MGKIATLFVFVLALAGSSLELYSQTIAWSLKPEYARIEHYADGLYKVRQGAYCGIVDKDGEEIVPVYADSISNISEGYGLVMNLVKGKYQLCGIVSSDRMYRQVYTECFVDEFPFFSNGMLPVSNRKGVYGYVNTKGELAIDFRYTSAYPFSNGYALVSGAASSAGRLFNKVVDGASSVLRKEKGAKSREVYYIDYKGKILELDPSIGEIYYGTTFHKGEAIVVPANMAMTVINIYGKKLREIPDQPLRYDRKNAVLPEGEKEEDYDFNPVYNGPEIYSSSEGYGFTSGGKSIVPPQFKHAERFSNGYAIVATGDGSYGLIKLLDDKFVCSEQEGTIETGGTGKISVNYVFTVPQEWKGKPLTLECIVNGKVSTSMQHGDFADTRTFSIVRDNGPCTIRLTGEGLVLWESGMASSGDEQKEDKTSDEEILENVYVRLSKKTTKASMELMNKAPVSVVLTNKLDKAVRIDVAIYAKEKGASDYLMNYTQKKGVEIEPGGFYTISGQIGAYGQKQPVKRTITIKLSTESGTEKYIYREITVEPIFVED